MRKILIFMLIFVAAGCQRVRVVRPVEYRTMEPTALLAAHNARARGISTLSADVRMTISWREDDKIKSHTANTWLDIERPSRIRLVHDAMGRDLFYVLSDGEWFWIGLDRAIDGERDTVTTGPVEALRESAWFLRPDRLLEITALPILPPQGAGDAITAEYPDRYVFFFPAEAGSGLAARAVFDRKDLRLARWEMFDNGQLALVVDYQEYLGDEHSAPRRIHVDWAAEEISATMTLRRVTVGEELSPRLWEYRWRERVEVYEIAPPGR